MKHDKIQYELKNKMTAFAQIWQPDDQKAVKTVICLIHGLGEHSQRYQHLAEFMCIKNIAIIATDLIGHGKSDGKRGHVDSYQMLNEQIDNLIQQAQQQFDSPNIFLYGHSMGGNIVMNYAIKSKYPIKGIISSAPFLKTPKPVPPSKLFLAKIMKNIYPTWTENNGLDPEKLSHLKEVVQNYKNDPLVHPYISVKWFYQAIEAADYIQQNIELLKIPMLLMHGTQDEMTDYNASEQLAKKNQQYITFKQWKDFYHELHNEPQQNEVMQLVANWIEQQS